MSKVSRIKNYIEYPHTRFMIISFILSIVCLVAAYIFNELKYSFVASTLQNIFAGLITGITIYVISNIRSRYRKQITVKEEGVDFIVDLIFKYYQNLNINSFNDPDCRHKLHKICFTLFSITAAVGPHTEDICEKIYKIFDVDKDQKMFLSFINELRSEEISIERMQEIYQELRLYDCTIKKLYTMLSNENSEIFKKLMHIDCSLF